MHEANPKPGLANRIGARFTKHVFTGHPDAQLRNGKYIGIPIRREIAELDRLGLGDKARTHFGLRPDLPVLLVTGGSQGARSLNAAVFGAAEWLRDAGVQVLHIIGPRNGHEAPATSSGVPYVATPYIDRTRAQVLVGFGGYVATPAYLAARRRKIPIVVHEANPKPGLANRIAEAAASLGRGDADRWLAEAVIEIVDMKGSGGTPDAQEPDNAG